MVAGLQDTGLAQMFSDLYLAARINDARKIQQLLGRGEDVNWASRGGSTPLCRAAQSGSVSALRVLLNDPNVIIEHRRKGGRTALFIAAQFAHVECVELLLEYGANPGTNVVVDGCQWTALDFVDAMRADTPVGPEKGRLDKIVAMLAHAMSDVAAPPATPGWDAPAPSSAVPTGQIGGDARHTGDRTEASDQDNRLAALMGQGVAERIGNQPLSSSIEPAAVATDKDELPPGWQALESRTTGDTYFFNSATV